GEPWADSAVSGLVMKEVKHYLKPEFINRLDEIIVFHPLGKDELNQILDLRLEHLSKRIEDLGLSLVIDDAARKLVLDSIDTLNYGARPLQRKIESMIENKIATLLINHKDQKGGTILVTVDGQEIKVELKKD